MLFRSFNFSDRPDLSQKWVRAICDEFYGVEAIHGYGFGQDEDQGQLGAWYVMSSIGLFDVKGLTAPGAEFQIGSPVFDKVTIALPKNLRKNSFTIDVKNNSKENIYIQETVVNGKKENSLRLPYQTLVNGGNLTIEMGNEPK